MRQAISAFNGTLIGPEDDGYDAHREVWNATVDRRPALIARCTSAEDVAAAIRHAREHDLEIGVKCGGHSVLGLCVPHEGLMIDLTPMDSVRVDPNRGAPRSAAARSSATWIRPRRLMAWPRRPATCRTPAWAG